MAKWAARHNPAQARLGTARLGTARLGTKRLPCRAVPPSVPDLRLRHGTKPFRAVPCRAARRARAAQVPRHEARH